MSLVFGFIKFFRGVNISNNNNDLRVYLHLLINANYKASNYKSYNIAKGQLVTSYTSIADVLKLTRKQVIIATQHLRDNGAIEWMGVPQNFSICTIKDYALQDNDKAFNFVKLYRSIQGSAWYADDVAARLYYYILQHTEDGLRVKRGAVVKALDITPHAFYTALDKLTTAGAIEYTKKGAEYIISTYADYDDKEHKTPATKSSPATKPSSTPTKPSLPTADGDDYLNQIFSGF